MFICLLFLHLYLTSFVQDVQYADIDHMDKQMDFTIDQEKFGGLNTYFKQLQAEGMHTIIILVSLDLVQYKLREELVKFYKI